MIESTIFDMVNLGIAVFDKDLHVQRWNRWMQVHSNIPVPEILHTSILDHYPNLNDKWFLRNVKAVLQFGIFAFFSHKVHQYTLPMKPVHNMAGEFDYMQQECTMGPLRNEANEIEYIYMIIQDVTEVAAYEQKLLDLNTRDSLTGIRNRRFFETRLQEEIDRHHRYACPLSLIMIDIDYFKNINDTHGHLAGDQVLIGVARCLNQRLRSLDTLARYGGEEFCVLMPATARQDATTVAEDLRRLIESQAFMYKEIPIKVTISLGVIEAAGPEITLDELLKRVDDALYSAKKRGRNMVATF
ncbi:MAG: diguanylate cyclase [Thermodesulfobacteriota bacterium]|nr:diguanylate cyclase [Thermodesulfobacteriota bacterium]